MKWAGYKKNTAAMDYVSNDTGFETVTGAVEALAKRSPGKKADCSYRGMRETLYN